MYEGKLHTEHDHGGGILMGGISSWNELRARILRCNNDGMGLETVVEGSEKQGKEELVSVCVHIV